MNRIRILFMLFLLSGAFASAQPDISSDDWRRRVIDSLYNPAVSETGTTMSFTGRVIDTGTIEENAGPKEYEFTWKNTGESPVTVLKVSTTCGCAVPSFDRAPVQPGDSSSLKITYHPKGHPGKFDRRIFVYTDLSGARPAAVLSLKGNVKASDIPVWMYRFQMGDLYLRRTEIRLDGSRKAVERITCLNAGASPLTLGVEPGLLPPFLSFRCEPETIQPGEEADIVISYDPDAVPARMLNIVPVILTGLDLPPSGRTLKVVFSDMRH